MMIVRKAIIFTCEIIINNLTCEIISFISTRNSLVTSLIIHKENIKEIMSVKESVYSDAGSVDFHNF